MNDTYGLKIDGTCLDALVLLDCFNCATYFDPALYVYIYKHCVAPCPDAIYRAFTCQEPSISNIMEFTCPRGVSPDLDVKQKRSTESPRWFVYQERVQKHPFHLKSRYPIHIIHPVRCFQPYVSPRNVRKTPILTTMFQMDCKYHLDTVDSRSKAAWRSDLDRNPWSFRRFELC